MCTICFLIVLQRRQMMFARNAFVGLLVANTGHGIMRRPREIGTTNDCMPPAGFPMRGFQRHRATISQKKDAIRSRNSIDCATHPKDQTETLSNTDIVRQSDLFAVGW